MSLKGFHIAFIIASVLLSAFFAAWGFQQYTVNSRPAFLVAAAGGLVAGISLIYYLLWFIKKLRNVRDPMIWLIALSIGGASRSIFACAVCIGDRNSPQVQSANAAVLFLLVIVSMVLTAFGATFLVWRKRAMSLSSTSS